MRYLGRITQTKKMRVGGKEKEKHTSEKWRKVSPSNKSPLTINSATGQRDFIQIKGENSKI